MAERYYYAYIKTNRIQNDAGNNKHRINDILDNSNGKGVIDECKPGTNKIGNILTLGKEMCTDRVGNFGIIAFTSNVIISMLKNKLSVEEFFLKKRYKKYCGIKETNLSDYAKQLIDAFLKCRSLFKYITKKKLITQQNIEKLGPNCTFKCWVY
ncbi:unnamed protein product [Cunninghamella blakesleeana]